MAADEIHVGDIGTVFEVTIKDGDSVVDVSSASTMQLLFLKSDKTTLTKTATHKTDGTDGIIQYATISGDLDVAGTWKLQAYIVISGNSWKSDVATFVVHANIA